MRSLILLLAVVTTSCALLPATTTTTTTVPPPVLGADTPEEAVRSWLAGLGERDYQSTMRLVPDRQLALLVATEGMNPEQTLRMLDEGVPSSVRRSFWQGFVEAFPGFSGEEVGELVVGGTRRFGNEGRQFAAVQVVFRERLGSGEVITHLDRTGRWWVDLFATFGPAFTRPLRTWLSELPAAGEGARVRQALGEERPSLTAGLERAPLGELSETTAAELRLLIAELPPPGS